MRNNQRTIQLFLGVIVVVLLELFSQLFGLTTVNALIQSIISWGVIALIVIFQPEIRSVLEKIGQSNALARISTLTSVQKERLIDELIEAVTNLSTSKTGALISLEQGTSLSEYINTGIKLDSVVSAELICSIFMTTTPLHDGAIIVQGDKLSCASAYFPPTTSPLPSKYGARHRAALGISEVSDAATIVVSEETGGVSVTYNGKLIPMNDVKLRNFLERVILNKEQVVDQNSFFSVSEGEYAKFKEDKKEEGVVGISNREMKLFKTSTFKVSDLNKEEKKEEKMVDTLISSVVKEYSLNDDVTVRTVSADKNDSGMIDTISVTTGTEQPQEQEGEKHE